MDLVARVTAFLEKRLFTEGAEVKEGDLLYRLERGPFEAQVAAKRPTSRRSRRSYQNATLTPGPRAGAAQHAGRPAQRPR